MLVLILSKESTSKFAAWSKMSAVLPGSAERDGGDLEKLRYYRLVLPIEPDSVSLSSHPLTWTTMSHVVWDNYPPTCFRFRSSKRCSTGFTGVGKSCCVAALASHFRSCAIVFSAPICRAKSPERRCLSRKTASSRFLSLILRPITPRSSKTRASRCLHRRAEVGPRRGRRVYRAPAPIRPGPKRPVYLTVLKPKAGRINRSRWAKRARTFSQSRAGSAEAGSRCSRSIPTKKRFWLGPGSIR